MDIAERLRKRATIWLSFGWGNNDIFDEAADEIERLRKRNGVLEKAIASMADKWVAQNWNPKAIADEMDAALEGK